MFYSVYRVIICIFNYDNQNDDIIIIFIDLCVSHFVQYGPYLALSRLTFYTDACIVAGLHPVQSYTTLAPGEVCRRKSEACSSANDTLLF